MMATRTASRWPRLSVLVACLLLVASPAPAQPGAASDGASAAEGLPKRKASRNRLEKRARRARLRFGAASVTVMDEKDARGLDDALTRMRRQEQAAQRRQERQAQQAQRRQERQAVQEQRRQERLKAKEARKAAGKPPRPRK